MSKLYAKIVADDRAPATRQANLNVEMWAQTEQGRITVGLNANGNFVIYRQPVGDHQAYNAAEVLATGNVNVSTVINK